MKEIRLTDQDRGIAASALDMPRASRPRGPDIPQLRRLLRLDKKLKLSELDGQTVDVRRLLSAVSAAVFDDDLEAAKRLLAKLPPELDGERKKTYALDDADHEELLKSIEEGANWHPSARARIVHAYEAVLAAKDCPTMNGR